MTQTNINTKSIKQLSNFLIEKHLKDEIESFDFNEFGALRFYQTTSKESVKNCINDQLGNKQIQNPEFPANAGNIILEQMNHHEHLQPQNHILTISSANMQCIATNKMGIDSTQTNTFIEELEKYIGDNYWLVNGVCKDITQSSECPKALQVAEISSYITSFLIHDNLYPSSKPIDISVGILGEKAENDISE